MNNRDDIAGMTMDLGRLIRQSIAAHPDQACSVLQMHALDFIEDHKGLTMSQFAEMMKISPSTATVFIDKLVRSKLVKRGVDAQNRKIIRLQLTPHGSDVMAENRKCKQAVLKKIFAPLSSKDRMELARIFSLILDRSSSSHD